MHWTVLRDGYGIQGLRPDSTSPAPAWTGGALRLPWALAACLAVAGCAHPLTSPAHFGSQPAIEIEGLGVCSGDPEARLRLDPEQPLVVLVHGCKASRGSYQTLAQVFELHGQQTACFHYDDRERITGAGAQLREALTQAARQMPSQPLLVVGHSQGGLVARTALANPEQASLPSSKIRLVTVSSPFAGIAAARHCGLPGFHVATLGTTVGVCRMVAGAKWNEIHFRSDLVAEPHPLAPQVSEHLVVRTDERGTCRVPPGASHDCEQDDYVFSLEEQTNPAMQRDDRVHAIEVTAGHVDVVGQPAGQPDELIRVLQEHEVLAPTPPERRAELASLLRRL